MHSIKHLLCSIRNQLNILSVIIAFLRISDEGWECGAGGGGLVYGLRTKNPRDILFEMSFLYVPPNII